MITKFRKTVHDRQGQSIVEYILLVSAVIVALLVFLGRGGIFDRSISNVTQSQGDRLIETAGNIFFLRLRDIIDGKKPS